MVTTVTVTILFSQVVRGYRSHLTRLSLVAYELIASAL